VIGIVLGSGLGNLANKIADPLTIPYKTIPGFPVSTAIGHKGNFIVGTLGGKTVIAMQGRIHYYEGYPMDMVTLPIRVMKVIGISIVRFQCAGGGITATESATDDIKDHIKQLRIAHRA
jgi:purine-nucleoside phosphorylase